MGENYDAAKQDFAIRSGLIQKQQIFSPEQLTEIYRCIQDTLDHGYDITCEQDVGRAQLKNKAIPPIEIDYRNCSEFGKNGCILDRCGYAVELNDHFYRSYIEEAFSPLHSPYFRQRLTNYLKNPRLRIFRNEEHLNRWENAVEELQLKTPQKFGVLLLVSSYPEIWDTVHADI